MMNQQMTKKTFNQLQVHMLGVYNSCPF